MAQNKTHAVMAQRHEPHDSPDDFPTPPWAARALCEWLDDHKYPIAEQRAWEPACGAGHMALPLMEYFNTVYASDVHDYGFGEVDDFLLPPQPDREPANWIITNPPFKLAEEFFHQTRRVEPNAGIALLCRSVWTEGVGRYQRVFKDHKPIVLQFCERVTMLKGRLEKPGARNTATAYAWFIWPPDHDLVNSLLGWIKPGTRARLELDQDYMA